MTITYTVIITPDPESPGWWNAEVPALPGCVSCGQSYEEAMEKIREAMAGYIAVLMEYGDQLPQDVWSARMPVEVAA
jgi:predicted RNase H-like HicB family nuclease